MQRAIVCAVFALAGLTSGAGAHAAGKVEVSYTQPQRFVDIGRDELERERTLEALTTFLQTLGGRLPAGRTLRLEVTDVDLAGELRPFRTRDLRVLRGGADWPRIALRYTLLADGSPIESGDAVISDMNYLAGRTGFDDGGELSYEKRMLRAWFDEHFGAR